VPEALIPASKSSETFEPAATLAEVTDLDRPDGFAAALDECASLRGLDFDALHRDSATRPSFSRWRFDKRPSDCAYDQLEVTTPYELAKVFGASDRSR